MSAGPTVYDYAHLGHAKTHTQFDLIVKYLKYKGYKRVFYLQNITDIDDKIINRANQEKTDWKEIAEKYEKEYFEDMENLGINSVNKYAKATDYIPEIISQVKRLIDKGVAYKISDGYYFDLTKFKEYGKLAKEKFWKKATLFQGLTKILKKEIQEIFACGNLKKKTNHSGKVN